MHTNKNTGTPGTVEATVASPEEARLRRFGTTKKIRVWYADPPWDIAQTGKRGAIKHYDLMTLDRIKSMGSVIQELSDDNVKRPGFRSESQQGESEHAQEVQSRAA